MRDKNGRFVKGNKPLAGFVKGHPHGKRFKKGLTPWIKGKKLEYKPHYKMRGKMAGEKNPAWQGGRIKLREKIRKSPEYKEWRLQIFGRDNFTCRSCGMRGGYLEAHHIKRFAKILDDNSVKTLKQALLCGELWLISNGITLCKKCHDTRAKLTIWWYNNISIDAVIGDGTSIGSFSDIGAVKIGKDCKIQTHVSIPKGWTFGDRVFIGPGVRFCNDKHPQVGAKWNPEGGKVGSDVAIGAGAIILPRINIGDGVTIGAGAVVTKNVPEGETWVGNPAKSIA